MDQEEVPSQPPLAQKQEFGIKQTTNKGPDYPMAMTFFKPLNLCVFGLLSSISIYKIKQ
jgi:hypothetical protein